MKRLSLSKIRDFFISYLPYIAFFGFIFFLFITNAVHESYPDEFDNILGGWYTLHGKPLYSGFFTHHNPIAYLLSAILEVFSGQSFVRFRLVYTFVLFIYIVWSFLFLRKRFGGKATHFYLFVILLFGIGATYFWGHMLLADNISALLLLPAISLLMLASYYNNKLVFSDMVYISILSSLAFLTSATYIYLVAIISLYALVLYVYENRVPLVSKRFFKVIFVFALPYIIFLLYLLITGSLVDYYYQNLVFNPRFYIYNYPRPEGATVNPIRYAIIIAHDFFNNFANLLLGVKDFNFHFPFNMTLAVANVGLIVYLLLARKYPLVIFTILVLIYTNVRTNPLTSRETDYQSSVYILFSFFAMAFVLNNLYVELKTPSLLYAQKLIYSFLILLVGIYTFFNLSFLLRKYDEKVFNKYMGQQALIYDRPQVAPVINSITEPNDIVWVGPFAFEELFYTNRPVPSKYIILLPEFGRFPYIRDEFLADFQRNKPKLIYFDKTYSIRGYMPGEYGGFFLKFLEENYITLLEYKDGATKYVSQIAPTEKLDIEAKLYINKQHTDEVIQKLLQHNLIRKVSLNEKN